MAILYSLVLLDDITHKTTLFLLPVYLSCLLTCNKSPISVAMFLFHASTQSSLFHRSHWLRLHVVLRVLNMEELQWTEEEEESAEHPYYNNIPGKMPPPGGIIDTRLINQNAAPDVCQVPLRYRKLLIIQDFSKILLSLISLCLYLIR